MTYDATTVTAGDIIAVKRPTNTDETYPAWCDRVEVDATTRDLVMVLVSPRDRVFKLNVLNREGQPNDLVRGWIGAAESRDAWRAICIERRARPCL
jgi:hypothetical protein